MMSGMAFFHSKNIAHRDIKPDNILVDIYSPGMTTKIIDFGFAA
jgi:calcium-dependent protein kinase|tara:strand:- start:651 stop:782 length:132 start_codon:yes stop_codon:yes gene_type:complete